MPRGLAATMALVTLGCFALALASWNGSPAFAEPDQPENVPEREITTGKAPKKKPAQQVPAEIIEKLLEEERAREEQAGKPSSDTDFDADEIARAEKALLSPKAPSPVTEDPADTADGAVKHEPDISSEQAATRIPPSVAPGLPRRKPRKPSIQAKDRKKADGKKKLIRGSDRQKHLCKALQSCRNDFIRCKSKIKHPDQSPQWSEEKEACGAIYKKCVEKDFQSGEWFFTRWFYFQELNCK